MLTAFLPAATATPALAKCQPYYNGSPRSDDNQYHFDGWYRSPGVTVGGIYSSILNYSPWVQPNGSGENHFVAAWTMLDHASSCSTCDYAQVGWFENPGGARYTFTQWTHDNTFSENDFSPQSVGSYTYYTTLYNNTPGKFTFQVAGSTIDTETAAFTPNEGEIYGEENTLASQMPGGYNSNAHEVFSDANIYLNGAYQAFSGTADPGNTTYFGNSKTSSQYDMVWDKACAS